MANSIVAYSSSGLVSRSGGNPSSTALSAASAAAIAAAPSSTALAAAMAVLVADGALPTQAHVTTANSALTTYLTAATTQQADVVAVDTALTTYLAAATVAQAGSVLVTYDPALTLNQVKTAILALLKQIEGIN